MGHCDKCGDWAWLFAFEFNGATYWLDGQCFSEESDEEGSR